MVSVSLVMSFEARLCATVIMWGNRDTVCIQYSHCCWSMEPFIPHLSFLKDGAHEQYRFYKWLSATSLWEMCIRLWVLFLRSEITVNVLWCMYLFFFFFLQIQVHTCRCEWRQPVIIWSGTTSQVAAMKTVDEKLKGSRTLHNKPASSAGNNSCHPNLKVLGTGGR